MRNFSSSNSKRTYKNWQKWKRIKKTISYRLKFIDSARFMVSYYPIFLIILLKEFTKLNVNTDMIMKNVKIAELNIDIVSAFLNTQN